MEFMKINNNVVLLNWDLLEYFFKFWVIDKTDIQLEKSDIEII